MRERTIRPYHAELSDFCDRVAMCLRLRYPIEKRLARYLIMLALTSWPRDERDRFVVNGAVELEAWCKEVIARLRSEFAPRVFDVVVGREMVVWVTDWLVQWMATHQQEQDKRVREGHLPAYDEYWRLARQASTELSAIRSLGF